MQFQVSVLCKPGGRVVNEDACGVWSSPTSGVCFCVVSDGAGGHGGGDVASKLVVERVLAWFRERPECSPEAIDAALRAANESVVNRQHAESRLADMRATVVALALDAREGVACWGHVGDSRLYYFQGARLAAQTRDHSVVQQMIDAGYLDAASIRHSNQRSVLIAALGDRGGVEPTVTTRVSSLNAGDRFLLCSDGFWEYVEESEMERTLDDAPTSEVWLRQLEDQLVARASSGHDNYSGLVVACL